MHSYRDRFILDVTYVTLPIYSVTHTGRARLIQTRLIGSFYENSVNSFPIISCLKCTVNSNFYLIRSKTLRMNDFELIVPNLYFILYT